MKKLYFLPIAIAIITVILAACKAEITKLPTGITLNHYSVTMIPGDTLTLIPDVIPDKADIKTVTWHSNNSGIATVTNNGVVTALAEGSVIITVTTNSGQKSAACALTIAYPVGGVTLDRISAVLSIGESTKLTARVWPEDAPDKSLKWESSDTNVLEVNNDGVVIAKALGAAVISVTTEVGNRIAKCAVRILSSDNYIFMTLDSIGSLYFSIIGNGEAVIDFGDGSEQIKHTLTIFNSIFTHNYSETRPYIITIEGANITKLDCKDNRLTRLDVSKNTTLTTLDCSNNQLITFNVSTNIALKSLNFSNNQLAGLDISQNRELTELVCNDNQLISLDISANTELKTLNCNNNQLTSLDVSKATLTTLNCSNNQLTSLDVSKATLTTLNCSNNQLANLNVSASISLNSLNCSNNKLSTEALNALFRTMHDNTPPFFKTIYISNNPGTNTCDRSIVPSWIIY